MHLMYLQTNNIHILPHISDVNLLRLSDTYKCVSKLTIIGSDNGLSPQQRQAIIWPKAGILIIVTNFGQILSEIQNIFIQENAFGNVICKMASILSWSQWC